MMTSHSNGSTAPTRIFLLVTAMAAVSCSVGTCSAQETLATVRAVQQFGAPIQSGANKSERKSARDARGFLFLEGEYVPPPYDVSATDDDVQVNGRSISDLLTGFRPSATRKRPLAGSTAAWAARRLQKDLDSGLIVVLFPGQPAKSSRLDSTADQFYELLLATDESQTVSAVDELCNRLAEGTDVALWRSWLTDYTPPAELTNRLRIYRETVDAIGLANEAQNNSVKRLHSFAYPLTTLGMVLSVFSIGHLLRNQATGGSSNEIDASPQATSFVTRSLILVLALSALDLVWTILASQAGQMRELNPLGSHLINSPLALLTFKAAITCGAAGLLFGLRRYRRAQAGAWWACLICTLLTMRWLVLNSLFIA